MTDAPLCPRCAVGRLSIDTDYASDTLRKCDECGMVFDTGFLSDDK